MINNLKHKMAVVRGRWQAIKQRDSDLRTSSVSYKAARGLVWISLRLVWFCVEVFWAFCVAAIFGSGGSTSKRGGYATREEIEGRQGGAPAYYDHDLGSYTGPNSRD